MVNSVTITNYLGESIDIVLREDDPWHGILIKKIDGLGPVNADINMTDLATRDGSIQNFSRARNRNIVMTLMFPGSTAEEARLLSYKYFPLKQPLTFKVVTDNREAETVGWVEKNDPNIFATDAKPEEAQISIVCEDAYFYDSRNGGTVVTNFFGATPLFEFPFDNNSLTEPLIEFGSIEVRSDRMVKYDGDAETGIIIKIKATGEVNDITFYRVDTRERIYIYVDKIEALTGAPFGAGDELIISTLRGNKYARLLRNGQYYNVLNALNRYPDWFQLSKGENVFAFTSEGTVSNLLVSFEYRTAYEGV